MISTSTAAAKEAGNAVSGQQPDGHGYRGHHDHNGHEDGMDSVGEPLNLSAEYT
jgi:hypothetical protein